MIMPSQCRPVRDRRGTPRARALLLVGIVLGAACSGSSGSGSTGPKSSLTVSGQVIGFGPLAGDFNFRQGDTIRVGIGATSNHTIDFIGVQFGLSSSDRDSIGLTGTDSLNGHALVTIIITGNVSEHVPVTIFAQDVTGNKVEITPGNGDHVWLYPVMSVTVDTLDDPALAGDRAYALDDAHHRLYIADATTGFRVYSFGTHTLISTIALIAPVRVFTVAGSGDTLVAVLAGHDSLAVVDVSGITPVVTSVPLLDATLGALVPDGIQTLGGDSAIVSVTCSLCARGRALLLVHLATGAHTDIGYTTASGADFVSLAASKDGSQLFIERQIGLTVGSPVAAQVYDVTHRSFTSELQPAFLGPGADAGAQFSANAMGTRMLIGEVLFNAPFATDTEFDAPYGSVRAVLSKSGDLIYVAVADGILELRAADLSAVAFFATPSLGGLPILSVTGDGTQLFVPSGTRLFFAPLPPALVAPDVAVAAPLGAAAPYSVAMRLGGITRP